MSVSRYRLLGACVALAVVVGVCSRSAGFASAVGLDDVPASRSAMLAESSPAGVVAPAVRLRSASGIEPVFDARSAKANAGLALAGSCGAAIAALVWWLHRREQGTAAPTLHRTSVMLRAPPSQTVLV